MGNAGASRDDNGGVGRPPGRVTTGNGEIRRRGGRDEEGVKPEGEGAEGLPNSGSVSGSSNPHGLTLGHQPARGGLLSKTGSLRMMAVTAAGAASGPRRGSRAFGENPTAAALRSPREEQHHGENVGDGGDRATAVATGEANRPTPGERAAGNAHDDPTVGVAGRTRNRRRTQQAVSQRPHNGESTHRACAASVTGRPKPRIEERLGESMFEGARDASCIATRGAGEVGQEPEAGTKVSRTGSGPDSLPPPSPASVSGNSVSPPSVRRPRRNFFDGRVNTTAGSGGNGDGGGRGGGGARSGAPSKTTIDKKPGREGRRESTAAPVEKKGAATRAASNGDGLKGRARSRSSRPTLSVAEAAAVAAASKEERDGRLRARQERRRRQSCSASPRGLVRRPYDTGEWDAAVEGEGGRGGGVMSKMFGSTASRRATAASNAAAAAATTPVEGGSIQKGSRPST